MARFNPVPICFPLARVMIRLVFSFFCFPLEAIMIGLDKILFLFFLTGMKGVVSEVDGSCNCVSAGGVGNNIGTSSSSSSSSTSAGAGVARTAVPMGVAKAGRFGRFLFSVWVLVEPSRKEFWTGTD